MMTKIGIATFLALLAAYEAKAACFNPNRPGTELQQEKECESKLSETSPVVLQALSGPFYKDDLFVGRFFGGNRAVLHLSASGEIIGGTYLTGDQYPLFSEMTRPTEKADSDKTTPAEFYLNLLKSFRH